MSKNRLRAWAIISMFFVCIISSFAQNNTSSPYSRFGYGEISDNGSGKSKGMGGVSLGMRSNSSINVANPASYSGIDSMTFLFEFGAIGKQSIFTDNSNSSSGKAFTASLEYLTMAFPLTKWLAGSIGILPYSVVGYSFSSTDSVIMPGADNYISNTKKFSGSGNLTQTYGGLSTKIGKHLALGVNLYYLFGTLTNEREISFNESTGTYYSTIYDNELQVRDFKLRYGLQYFTTLKNNNRLTLGLILETKSKLSGKCTTGMSGIDTVTTHNGFETPFLIGAGASYTINNRITLGADFQFQNWAKAKFYGVTDTLKNQTKFNIGAEFLPARFTRNYFSRVVYRVGGGISSGYFSTNNKTPNYYTLTFGLGLPTRGSKSMVNLAVEYGRIGNAVSGQLREDYFKFSINATFNEMWFFKRRFE